MNYFKPYMFQVRLVFCYQEKHYSGRGRLTWTPKEGFHIEAALTTTNKPTVLAVGGLDIHRPDTLRLNLYSRGHIAIAPTFYAGTNDIDISWHQWLSTNLDKVVFSTLIQSDEAESLWRGFGLYNVGKLLLPDKVETDVRLDGTKVRSNWKLSGLALREGKDHKVLARVDDEGHLELFATLAQTEFTKRQAWEWIEVFGEALSILAGKRIVLLHRRLRHRNRERDEFRSAREIVDLGFLSLFEDNKMINRAVLVQLTDFLTRNPRRRWLCWNIFRQLITAVSQTNIHARELMVATILEAALRSLYNIPFESKRSKSKKAWNVGIGLKSLFVDYLVPHWIGSDNAVTDNIQSQVMIYYAFLRDRNAHPDWFVETQGTMSRQDSFRSMSAMTFLSRFYGYMILAIAGIETKPAFPRPYEDQSATWGRVGL